MKQEIAEIDQEQQGKAEVAGTSQFMMKPNPKFSNHVKIGWYSVAPFICSGYGTVTRHTTADLIANGYDTVIIAYYGIQAGGYLKLGDTIVVPVERNAPGDPFGFKQTKEHFKKFKRDVLIYHTDFWISEGLVKILPDCYCYSPIDSEMYPEKFQNILKMYQGVLVPSQHGVAEVKKYGVTAEYMPHGINTAVFKPMNRIECRKFFKLQPDFFYLGIVAANSDKEPRKGWDAAFQAIAMFLEANPDARKKFKVIIHTNYKDKDGYNLSGLAKTCQIDKYITFQDPYLALIGLPDPLLTRLYNSLDVMLMLSAREGYCLPVAEAGACGIPSIVTDFAALPERVNHGKCGWLVPKKGLKISPINAFSAIPNAEGGAKALEDAYYDQHKRHVLGKKAVLWNRQFDWHTVFHKYWIPWLDKIDEQYGYSKGKKLSDRKVLEV